KGDLARTWWGKKCSQRRGARPGERGGHHTADEGKQKRFGEALLQDAAARCAQGSAHGELMLARLQARGLQSAKIDATEQQNQEHEALQQQQRLPVLVLEKGHSPAGRSRAKRRLPEERIG